MEKIAMNLFNTYKQFLDANGNPIYMKDGKWVDKSGNPLKGKMPKSKSYDLPVMTLEDLKQSTPLLAKVLPLKKYQDVIVALQTKVKLSESGVVNFIVGKETKIPDAILKAAFPPGSGVVYKGYDGFSIDAASWADPQVAKQQFTQLLKGRQRVLSESELETIRELSTIADGTALPLAGFDSLFDPQAQGQAQPATPTTTARGGGQPQPQAQANTLDAFIKAIKQRSKLLKEIVTKKRGIDRFSKDPKARSSWLLLDQGEHKCKEDIAAIQNMANLHRFTDWTGKPQYDGSGFMDFEMDRKDIQKQVMLLMSPKDLLALQRNTERKIKEQRENAAAAINKTPEPLQILPDEQAIAASGNAIKESLKKTFVSLLPTLSEEARKEANKMIQILSYDIKTISTSADTLKETYDGFDIAARDMHGIMVVNNVNPGQSGLALMRGSTGGVEFTASDVLRNEWVSNDVRRKRCMIIVSSGPINFGFDGYEVVDLKDFSVDEEEGEALVEYFITQYRNNLQKQGVDVANVRINRGDINRINLVLQGKNQTKALQLLSSAFNSAMIVDKDEEGKTKNTYIDGEKLWRAAMEKSNSLVRDEASGPDNDGVSRACYYIKPRIMMKNYIRVRKSDWGSFVNRTNGKIADGMERMTKQDHLRQQLWDLEEKGGSLKEKLSVEKELSNIDNELMATMQGIPHVMILYGSPGCGKSAYPEALADHLKFQLLDVSFGQTKGSLVGQTEKWTRALMESFKKMANVVIRLDEFDGQMASSGGDSEASYNASQVSELLTFLQDNKQLFDKRNVFIVMTTNNPDRIRNAIQDRAFVHEVPDPFDAEGYEEFLNNSIELVSKDCACGCIYDPDNPNRSSDLWPETKALMNSIAPSFPAIAKSLEGSGLNFRKMGDLVKSMWASHMEFVTSSRKQRIQKENPKQFQKDYPNSWRMEDGKVVMDPVKIQGFPLTAENFIKVAEKTHPTDLKGVQIGIDQVKAGASHRSKLGIDALQKEYDENPSLSRTGKWDKTTDNQQQMAFDLDSPAAPVSNDDLIVTPTSDTVASTDYYFNALVKSGIVNASGEMKQAARKIPHIRGRKKDLDPDESGIFYFENIVIAPVKAASNSVTPQPAQYPAKG